MPVNTNFHSLWAAFNLEGQKICKPALETFTISSYVMSEAAESALSGN